MQRAQLAGGPTVVAAKKRRAGELSSQPMQEKWRLQCA